MIPCIKMFLGFHASDTSEANSLKDRFFIFYRVCEHVIVLRMVSTGNVLGGDVFTSPSESDTLKLPFT
jgi:hypothetical protein